MSLQFYRMLIASLVGGFLVGCAQQATPVSVDPASETVGDSSNSGESQVADDGVIKILATKAASIDKPFEVRPIEVWTLGASFSPDGRWLSTSDSIIDWKEGKVIPSSEKKQNLAITKDGQNAVYVNIEQKGAESGVATLKIAKVEDDSQSRVIARWESPFLVINNLVISGDDKLVAVSHDEYFGTGEERKQILNVWRIETGENILSKTVPTMAIHPMGFAMAFSPDSQSLLTGIDADLTSWDLRDGTQKWTKKVQEDGYALVKSLFFSQVLNGFIDGDYRVWKSDGTLDKKFSVVSNFEEFGGDVSVESRIYSADGRYLVMQEFAEGSKIYIIDILRNRAMGMIPAGESGSISMTPDNKQVVLVLNDKEIRVWNIESLLK